MKHCIKTTHGEISCIDNGVSGPSILFIHGNSSCKEVFEKQFSSPLGSRYRLVAFDLPGHGESFRADETQAAYSIQYMAKLVAEVSQQLSLVNPVLVGWSLGGHIAIESVAQGFNANGLLIVGTPPFGPGVEGIESAFRPSDHMELTGQEVFSADDAANYAAATLGGEDMVTDHLLAQVAGCDGRARKNIIMQWGNPKNGHAAIPFVAQWDKPIAVVHGELDPFVQLEHLKGLEWGNLWGAEVQVIEAAGHAPFWQRPDQFNELLSKFMQTHLADSNETKSTGGEV